MLRARRVAGAVLVLAGAGIAAVAIESGPPGGAASAAAAVNAYVAGYSNREGAEICRLLVPEVARGVGPALARSGEKPVRSCAAALEEHIEGSSDAKEEYDQYTIWSRATVRSRRLRAAGNGRADVRLRIFHEYLSDVMVPSETNEVDTDRIALERRDGRWFVASVGRLFYVATGGRPPVWALDPPLTPNLARRRARLPRPPDGCAGPGRRVTRYAARERSDMEIAPYVDIRDIEVRRLRSRGACVHVRLAGPPRPATEVGVSFEYYQGRQTEIHPKGALLRCGTASLRFDSAGRTHPMMFSQYGTVSRAQAGGSGATLTFRIRPKRGYGLRRLRFSVFADSHRKVGPDRAVRVDTYPSGDRFLRDDPGSSPKPSSCLRTRPQVRPSDV